MVFTRIPPQFLDDTAHNSRFVNYEYFVWLQKDQMLLSGLQSTLSSKILSHVLRCSDTLQLWNHLFSYFQKQTCARARQLRVERHAIMLDALSTQGYFLKIKTIIDVLTSIGDPLPSSHHINVILEGLSSE